MTDWQKGYQQLSKLSAKGLWLLIRAYQLFISPVLGQSCRFYPSCSCYFQQALEQHGVVKGSYLGVRRICRCHPGHPGGLDPVPPNTKNPSVH